MSALIMVPRDKSLDQVLRTDQVYMLIIGSSQRAGDPGRPATSSEGPRPAAPSR